MILLGGSRPRLTSSQQPTSNEEMPDHDADADVIAAGPEPGRRPPWPGGLVWLIVLAVTGTVVITAAALPGAGLVEFTVSAVITGGQPGTVYDLDGNDCSTISPLGDHVWATGGN